MASFTGDAIGSPQLAASLLALGIPPKRGGFVIRVGDVPADQAILYRFEERSDCGQFSTRACIAEWRKGSFPAGSQLPIHAMGRMWQGYRANSEAMTRPQIPTVPPGCYSTPDRLLAAAIESMGHQPHASIPISRPDGKCYWHFPDNDEVRRVAVLFRDIEHVKRNRHDLLSYLSAAALSWWRLVENIKTADPFAVVRHKDKHIAVSVNSSQHTQDRFGQLLEGKWRIKD
jgi:hypothetical protein